MANWKYKINIKAEWEDAQAGKLTIQDLAKATRTRLCALPAYKSDGDLIDICQALEGIADDKEATADDFDGVWASLYDWGDTVLVADWPPTKMCWIGTF